MSILTIRAKNKFHPIHNMFTPKKAMDEVTYRKKTLLHTQPTQGILSCYLYYLRGRTAFYLCDIVDDDAKIFFLRMVVSFDENLLQGKRSN